MQLLKHGHPAEVEVDAEAVVEAGGVNLNSLNQTAAVFSNPPTKANRGNKPAHITADLFITAKSG